MRRSSRNNTSNSQATGAAYYYSESRKESVWSEPKAPKTPNATTGKRRLSPSKSVRPTPSGPRPKVPAPKTEDSYGDDFDAFSPEAKSAGKKIDFDPDDEMMGKGPDVGDVFS